MSRSSVIPLILLVAFLAQMFAGFGEVLGAVWCVGSDGEVRLETALVGGDSAAHCAGGREGEPDEHFPHSDEHCRNCFDFQAGPACVLPSRASSGESGFPTVLPSAPAVISCFAPPIPDEGRLLTFSLAPPQLLFLRTIVLRI